LEPGKQWLTETAISERAAQAWSQPRTAVCLLACGSAATEVETVNDFVTALHTAGANAIIGTECIIGENSSAEFAEHVMATLGTGSAKETLGETMTRFRRKLVNQGIPLGFVFKSLGDVDLTVEVKP
jgi:hypothetical protein